jgi:hypothetical protein
VPPANALATTLTNTLAKLARADEHLAALDEEAREAGSREPCSVVMERQGDRTYIARVRISEAPPLRLGLILGDVLYNWRSALDNMIQPLVRLNGQTPGRNSSFPVFHDERDFESRGVKRIRGVSEEHAAIIASLQPFPGRTDPTIMALDLVNEHCNADKHAATHPAIVAVRHPEQTARSFRREPVATEFKFEFDPVGFEKPLADGMEIARITPVGGPPETKPKLEAELTFELAFGGRGLAMKALPAVREHIHAIVERFQA